MLVAGLALCALRLRGTIRDAWGFLTGPVAHSGLILPLVAGAFVALELNAGAGGL